MSIGPRVASVRLWPNCTTHMWSKVIYKPISLTTGGYEMPATKSPGRTSIARTRLSVAEHKALVAAAELAGLTPSQWLRMVIRQEAMARLHAAGKSSGL